MKVILSLAVTLLLISCANTMQSASISEAYKKFESQEYDRTLELIIRAENSNETSLEMRAELAYLKAQTYDKMGEQRTATTLYEYLVEKHADSQYAYLAKEKLTSR